MINKSLFALVKSLSKSEKRYIQLEQLSSKGDRTLIYANLFNAICKVDDYKTTLSAFQHLAKKKYNNVQNYLYHLILTGLRNFKSESSIKIKLKNMLIDVEVLFEKGLMEQCLKKLDQAESVAGKYMLNEEQYEIATFKQSVFVQKNLLFHNSPQVKEQGLYLAIASQKRAVANLESEMNYRELSTNYFSDASQFSTKAKAATHLNSLMKNPLMNVADDKLSGEAWSSMISLKSLAYLFAGKYKEGIKYSYHHIKTIEKKYLHIAESSTISWVSAIYNYISYCYCLKKYDDLLIYLEKIKQILASSKNKGNKLAYTRLWVNYYQYRLVISIKTAALDNVSDIVKEMKVFLADNFEYVEDEFFVTLYYLPAYCYFMKGNYKESAYWVNKILNETNSKVRPDYQLHARILYFILQLERGRVDLYAHAKEQYLKCLSLTLNAGGFEKSVMEFMESSVRANSNNGLMNAFIQLKKKMRTLKKNKDEEEKITYYFDYRVWVEAMITQRSFIETYKRLNNNNK